MPVDHISHLTAPVAGQGPRNKSFFRTFAQYLCSNLGLLIIAIAYSIGGAFLFALLEQYIELQNCQEGSVKENVSIANISETMYNLVAVSTDNNSVIFGQIATLLDNFTGDVYQRRGDYRYSGQNCTTSSGWNFPSALFFTISVIAAIGYGHITPTTWEGQITCICYALIGIPIFLLCLSNISSILGDIFRFMYSSFLHCLCCGCRSFARHRRRAKRARRSRKSPTEHDMDYLGTATVDPTWPEVNPVHNDRVDGDEDDDEDELDEEELDDVWNRMEGQVPIGAVIAIIVGYIALGALMFSKTEGWTIVQSVYFCYVSLSTIGFGDYIPGITAGGTSGLRFVAACLYIVLGLAILAMCFDLLKESIVEKFRWLGHKFGIVAEDEDQVDEDRTQYANFEYAQQRESSARHLHSRMKSASPYDSPPAYEAGPNDEQWLNNIRDKEETVGNVSKKPRGNQQGGRR